MKFPRPFSKLLESFKSRWHSFNVLRKSPQIWRRDFKSRLRPSRDNEAGTCLVTSSITSPSFVRFVAKSWISAPNSAYCIAEQDHSELVRVLLATMGITVDAVPCLLGRELPKKTAEAYKPAFFAWEKPMSHSCQATLPSLTISAALTKDMMKMKDKFER